MPDRPSDLPMTSKGAYPSPKEAARRMALLRVAILRWLLDAGWTRASASAQAHALEPSVSQWLAHTAPEQLFDRLPSLAELLRKRLSPTDPLTARAFVNAFAHGMIALAVDEVESEALRAGHAGAFASLRPYLHSDPTPANLAEICSRLQLSQAALAIALTRLRSRLRQRIEAALTLWAASPETRHTLRRKLQQSLIGTESIP
jgi:hypothetical protein